MIRDSLNNCSPVKPNAEGPPGDCAVRGPRAAGVILLALAFAGPASAQSEAPRNAYFGDLHVHTSYSMDAFAFGTRATPDDAYRFAKGKAIDHTAGFKIQLDRPLDFYAVSDHANLLGMMEAMSMPGHPLSKLPRAKEFTEPVTLAERQFAFRNAGRYLRQHLDKDVLKSAWQRVVESAERFNDPGEFTTFAAYEYTSGGGVNLHRNVIYKGQAPPGPVFSRLDSLNPEDLWDWMDEQRGLGYEALAIPHNSNASNGRMFSLKSYAGEPLDADYADQRMRNEPLVEITQVKATSETHPFLSPNDEWADFEISPYRITSYLKSRPRGSYVREAWGNGLMLEQNEGFNPFRFGVIGSTDGHNGAGSVEEDNFFGKVGALDASGELRGSVAVKAADGHDLYNETFAPIRFWGASGLAGVWAEENTRESIYAALRRKETFGTSGPRIKVRLFGGVDLPTDLASHDDAVEAAYSDGVPMGGEISSGVDAPVFFAWALKDPEGTNLQRLQMVKVWVDGSQPSERVFDIACSDGATVDTATHRCPDNGAQVDLSDCSITEGRGAIELTSSWKDPEWRQGQGAAYYVRVLENPTCRWSTWDALRAGTPLRPDLSATIQERAWSSPIWLRTR